VIERLHELAEQLPDELDSVRAFCDASSDASPTSSTASCSVTPTPNRPRVREDTRGQLPNPARPASTLTSTLRASHFPDTPPQTLQPRQAKSTGHREAPLTRRVLHVDHGL
jgi:hypothetical protein